MTLPLLVFIGVLAMVLVPYIMFVTRPEDQSKRKLSKRLKSTAADKRAQLALVRETERLSSLGPVDRVLNYAGRIVVPTQQLIEQSGLKMSVGTLLLTRYDGSVACPRAGPRTAPAPKGSGWTRSRCPC